MLTILKIGGSVITDKSAEGATRMAEIKRVASEISGFSGQLVIVHGAGSFGHPQAKRYALGTGFSSDGLINTHRSVKTLNMIFTDALVNAGIPAFPVHPLGCMVLERGRIRSAELAPLKILLARGMVPVLHGDVVADTALGASVLSGDQLVTYLARKLGAGRTGAGTDVDGVLDDKGGVIRRISRDNFEQVRLHIRGASNDVTGGMLGKVTELLDLAGGGIDSCIFNAMKSGMTSGFLAGGCPGTVISDK